MKGIEQFGFVVLLATLWFKTMLVPALLVNYEIRKEFIIKNYCVNKDIVELHCDGKCYLAKQLKAARQESERQAETQFFCKFLGFECLSAQRQFVFGESGLECEKRMQISPFRNLLFSQNYFTSVFHPPRIFF